MFINFPAVHKLKATLYLQSWTFALAFRPKATQQYLIIGSAHAKPHFRSCMILKFKTLDYLIEMMTFPSSTSQWNNLNLILMEHEKSEYMWFIHLKRSLLLLHNIDILQEKFSVNPVWPWSWQYSTFSHCKTLHLVCNHLPSGRH